MNALKNEAVEFTNSDEIVAARQRLNRLRDFLLKMKMIVENDDAVATFDKAENDLRAALKIFQDRDLQPEQLNSAQAA